MAYYRSRVCSQCVWLLRLIIRSNRRFNPLRPGIAERFLADAELVLSNSFFITFPIADLGYHPYTAYAHGVVDPLAPQIHITFRREFNDLGILA